MSIEVTEWRQGRLDKCNYLLDNTVADRVINFVGNGWKFLRLIASPIRKEALVLRMRFLLPLFICIR